jgi:hypothetical protein
MSRAVSALVENYARIGSDFESFYPDLQQFTTKKLDEIGQKSIL